MRHKPTKIEMRIWNVKEPLDILHHPRFVIVDGRGRWWTGKGWSRKRFLLYASADLLRDDIEKLKQRYY